MKISDDNKSFITGQTIELSNIKLSGKGTCDGGANPRPPLHDYPLLGWCHTGHPKHGTCVFTEDQKASVEEIASVAAETPNLQAIANRFGTTRDHVAQAIQYAINAGFLRAN